MGSKVKSTMNLKPPFTGVGITENGGKMQLGIENGELRPYELLLTALGTCLFSTFSDIAEKQRNQFEEADISISGEKRDEVPMTLKYCRIEMRVKGGQKEAGLKKAFELACKYCSIYQTLSHVAQMDAEIFFDQ